MPRVGPVFKRELAEMVGAKSFLIGTIIGPLLMVGIFAVQFLIIAKAGGGEHKVAIVDASGVDVGARMKQVLEAPRQRIGFINEPTFVVEAEAMPESGRMVTSERLRARVRSEELDGFLWVPADIAAGGQAEYEGDNATNSGAMSALRQALQRSVQSHRLSSEGIDEVRLTTALAPVRFHAVKTAGGNPMAARLLAFAMAFAMYVLVLGYGQTIMQAVQEEKRDRIVEVIVSSIRARDLFIGKVSAIGTAGLLQMLIWVVAAALLMTNSAAIAGLIGADEAMITALREQSLMPQVPLSVGLLFLACFLGGFFLFATLFAVIGAIVTNLQEAQQFVLPVMIPFILGLFIAMPAAENPDSAIAVVGSFVPFTAPLVMPVRAMMTNVTAVEIMVSLGLLYATAAGILVMSAKIYRTAIFATGKKPSFGELLHWMRVA